MKNTVFKQKAVARVFETYPSTIRPKLLALRELIFKTAATTPGVGALEETLKWGEPAYVTAETGSGSTVRIGWKKSTPSHYAIYFHCQTNLIDSFRIRFPTEFRYEGNRAIIFNIVDDVPENLLAVCVSQALTYHASKKTGG